MNEEGLGGGRLRLHGVFTPPVEVAVFRRAGTGCSAIAWQAEADGQPCVLKQLHPAWMAEERHPGERARVPAALWRRRHAAGWRFVRAFYRQARFQRMAGLTDRVVHLRGLYWANGVWYTLTEGTDGVPWDQIRGEPASRLVAIALQIAEMTQQLHQSGWLAVDIKASNYLIGSHEGGLTVRMADFDSFVPLHSAGRQRRFLCSSQTAPPELLRGQSADVGEHSDVYSIAAMLLNKLAGLASQEDVKKVFPRCAPDLPQGQRERLYRVLLGALDGDPRRRTADCHVLAAGLRAVLC